MITAAETPPATATITDAATSPASPKWLAGPSTQAPGLAQPSSVTPGALPYPTTAGRPIGNTLAQPQYVSPVAPQSPAKSDAFIISDKQGGAVAAAPPALSSPLAQPKPFVSPPTQPNATPPQKKRSLWEFVLGPSQPQTPLQDPFVAMAARPANPSAEAQATPANSPAMNVTPQPTSGGGSLWNQLLGKNKPAPQPAAPAAPRVAATTPLPHGPGALVSQLVPASASVEHVITMELPPGPRPTLSDIEATHTPATSMTIGKPGMPANKDEPVYPSSQVAEPSQAPPGSLPVPSIPTEAYANAASALWRPFVMTTDAPSAAMPVMSAPATPADVAYAELPESERVHSLLRPWYATNPPTAAGTSGGQTAVAANAPQSIPEAIAQSSLGRQLSMAYTEDLRTPMNASIDAQVKKSQEPWDGRITVEWPLLANPFTMTNTPPAPPTYVATAPRSAQPVAFLQEPLPDPATNSDSSDPLAAPENDDDGARPADDTKQNEKETLAGASAIGTAPDDTSLNFLRAQTVLLPPGKHQFDIGIEYLVTENTFPVLITDGSGNVIGVDEVQFKGRELTVPMELRYGLLRRLQGFVQVPVGWANVQAAVRNYDEYENDGGIGDIGFGLTAQLRDAYKDCPYIIGTVAGLAPTGGNPFGVLGTITPNAPSLGNGFWAISGNLLWVQTRYDPVVVFYGFGARYQFEREYFGIEFAPGLEANYTLGTGFAVNERVTLSAQFFGAYIDDLKANGERVEGSNQEPMNLRLAATLAKPCNRLVEPFVTFGLTDDSISANFGITWTY